MDAVGFWLVPLLVVALLALPRPQRFLVRCVIAVLAGWLCTVLLFKLGYDPSGMAGDAAAVQAGAGDGASNLRIAMFFGWVCPTAIALVFAALRFVWLRLRRGRA